MRLISSRRRKLVAGLVLVIAVTATLVGGLTLQAKGGVRAEAGGAATSSRFVLNMSVAPATLDPAQACGFSDLTVIMNVYMRITRYGSKPGPNGTTQVDPGNIVPYFATSWKITNGGKKYTFKLRRRREVPEWRAGGREGRQVLLPALDRDGRLRRLLHLRRHLRAAPDQVDRDPRPDDRRDHAQRAKRELPPGSRRSRPPRSSTRASSKPTAASRPVSSTQYMSSHVAGSGPFLA